MAEPTTMTAEECKRREYALVAGAIGLYLLGLAIGSKSKKRAR